MIRVSMYTAIQAWDLSTVGWPGFGLRESLVQWDQWQYWANCGSHHLARFGLRAIYDRERALNDLQSGLAKHHNGIHDIPQWENQRVAQNMHSVMDWRSLYCR